MTYFTRFAIACSVLSLAACAPQAVQETGTQAENTEHKELSKLPGAQLNAAIQAETETLEWLEEVDGEEALAFAKAMNEQSLSKLTNDPRYQRLYDRALEVLQSSDRIPYVTVRGGELFNLWRDSDYTHGLWRKTTPQSYASDAIEWETVLDLDALADAEDKNWVWRGADCLAPDYRHCMITLSDGGSDAAVTREWDMQTRSFVEDGFEIAQTKGGSSWIDADTLLIATTLDPEEATQSGYPFVVKRWTRGTPIEAAQDVIRGAQTDVGVWSARFEDSQGNAYMVAIQAETFFETVYWYLPDNATGEAVKMPLPRQVSPVAIFAGQFVFTTNEDWNPVEGGETYTAGTVLSYDIAEFTQTGDLPEVKIVFSPNARQSIGSVSNTANQLFMVINDNVAGGLEAFNYGEKGWSSQSISGPDNASISIVTTDDKSDLAYLRIESFLSPETLYSVTADLELETAKSAPSWFEVEGFNVEQRMATSRDGTQIPYFIVKASEMSEAGPTLLYGYGGFQVTLDPFYSGTMGRSWLENGGTYVLANIRGGGEFGPNWHQAGLRTERQKIYDDFIAVAEALIADGVTTPDLLAVQGGSNGGLLAGVMYTQRPDLFGAVISQVPLLDMLRYHLLLAGASWQDEYGFPDENEDERAFLKSISPLHNVETGKTYPPLFLLTSTKDDRVHPGHARKMAYLLKEMEQDVRYYENMEGGHSAAANLEESARRIALEYTFLMQELMGEAE